MTTRRNTVDKKQNFVGSFFDTIKRKKHPSEYLYHSEESKSDFRGLSGIFSKHSKKPNPSIPNFKNMALRGRLEDFISIETKVSEGLYGPVYKAKLIRLDILVAAKRISPDQEEHASETLQKEMTKLQKISHENLVSYLGAHIIPISSQSLLSQNCEVWVVSAWQNPGSALKLREKRRLTEAEVGVIIAQALKGLKHLNLQKLVHGALKAANILLSDEGVPKLCDYGLASCLNRLATPSLSQSAKSKTTVYWTPPEILADDCEFSENGDVWSLGMCLHELVDGQTPFHGKTLLKTVGMLSGIGSWNKDFNQPKQWSPELNEFVNLCLIEDHKARQTPSQIYEHPFVQKYAKADPKQILQPLIKKLEDPLSEFFRSQEKETQQIGKWVPDTDPEHIVFSESESSDPSDTGIKAASLHCLVEAATKGDSELIEKSLILTFPTYTNGNDLLNLLVQRFQAAEISKSKKVKESVARILTYWITHLPNEFQCTSLGKKMNLVLTSSSLGQQLPPAIMNKIELLQDKKRLKKQTIKDYIDSTQKPDSDPANPPELFTTSSKVIAEQMTLIEWKIIQNISPHEFLKQSWNKKDAITKAPWLLFYVDWFNQRSRWFSTALLKEESPKERAVLLEKFIDIGQELVRLRNYNGVFEICACLFSAPIGRLKMSWAKVSEKHKNSLANLEELVNPQGNYKKYRECIKASEPPTLPYIGLMLTDFTFMDEANSDKTEDLINVQKVGLFGYNIDLFLFNLSQPYDVQEIDSVKRLLVHCEPWAEQDFYNVSKIREDSSQEKKKEKKEEEPSSGSFFLSIPPSGKTDVAIGGDFTEQDLNLLLGASTEITFAPQECILGDTEEAGGLFRVKTGLVSVERRDYHNKYHEVDSLQAGDLFGETSILPHTSSLYSYTSVKTTVIQFIPVDLLQKFLSTNVHLARRFFKRVATILAVRIQQWTQHTNSKGSTLRKGGESLGLSTEGGMSSGSQPVDVNEEVSRIFNLKEAPSVLKKYATSFEHAKGYLFLTKSVFYFSGSVFGFGFKKILLINAIKNFEDHKSTVTIYAGEKDYEVQFRSVNEKSEALSLMKSLLEQASSLSGSDNAKKQQLIRASPSQHSSQTDPLRLRLEDWKVILQGNKSKSYEPETTILLEGAPYKQRLFQVVSGSCRVEKKIKSNSVVVATIKEGEIFGELSFLTQGASAGSVITNEKTEVLKLEGYFLNIIFQRHLDLGPKFYRFLGETISSRLSQKEEVLKNEQEKSHNHPSKLSIKRSTRSVLVKPPPTENQ